MAVGLSALHLGQNHFPFGFHDCGFIRSAFRTEPLSLWLPLQLNTSKVEPLNGAQIVVAANHLSIRDLVTETVGWLVRINLNIGQSVRTVSALLLRLLHCCLFGSSSFDNLLIGLIDFCFSCFFWAFWQPRWDFWEVEVKQWVHLPSHSQCL